MAPDAQKTFTSTASRLLRRWRSVIAAMQASFLFSYAWNSINQD